MRRSWRRIGVRWPRRGSAGAGHPGPSSLDFNPRPDRAEPLRPSDGHHPVPSHELPCPRCTTPLACVPIGGISVDVCESCGGLWLDRLELARFDEPDSVLGEALLAHLGQFPVAIVDRSVRLNCPRHPGVVMMRRPFSPAAPVEIDECPQCGGQWLDADELAQIRR